RPRHFTRRHVVAASIMVGMMATSCSLMSDDLSKPPDDAIHAQAELDAASLLHEQVTEVENSLIQECLTAAGFSVFQPTPEAISDTYDRMTQVSPELSSAESEGYGLRNQFEAIEGQASGSPSQSEWEAAGDVYHQQYF